ncbi:PEP-CTERM sorting domain-containing protein [Azohydromonas caseinilytica]|uniref:PEP-CTERM sorting domain-containing protein n=1 Tax=Azohydromonas caseinilytica TaxID=2728836 RepID=A0A848F987_9BURK|nr:PEP-CTERM sorting domain-containing protein [Azohydromonas caseinilytica]NML15386.1 PEP-CTERM sorting domain-containing protein [Azohydromonas caseinilytica]
MTLLNKLNHFFLKKSMSKIKKLLSVAGIVGGALATLDAAQANFCGMPGLPACAVPEPGSLPLVIVGIAGAAVVARFFKKK